MLLHGTHCTKPGLMTCNRNRWAKKWGVRGRLEHGTQPKGSEDWRQYNYQLTCFGVLLWQHIVGKRRSVGEALQDGVQVAGVPHVLQACTNAVILAPLQVEALWREEDLLGQLNSIAVAYGWTHRISILITFGLIHLPNQQLHPHMLHCTTYCYRVMEHSSVLL